MIDDSYTSNQITYHRLKREWKALEEAVKEEEERKEKKRRKKEEAEKGDQSRPFVLCQREHHR